jgi:ubiquinone/menaquinone biosynthesis C-methylase UbiE
MTHADHVALIRPGAEGSAGAWADLGAGSGAFTLALAAVLGHASRIYAVDRDAGALGMLERALQRERGRAKDIPLVQTVHADLRGEVPLPPLDGILMANSLHFQADACAVLTHAARWLKPGGRLIIVEYDIETPNTWVPNPIPWSRLPAVLECAGFSAARLLGTRPSRYHGRMYSARALLDATGATPP